MLSVMNMDQKIYWDDAAAEKDFTTPFQMDLFKSHVKPSSKILDVGCGYGRILEMLRQEGYTRSCGIDSSGRMIERGKECYPHLNLKETGSLSGFEDRSFDVVTLVAVLTCIAKESEQAVLIGEIRRVLKTGGLLYINDFLINNDERNKFRYRKFEKKYGTYGIFELDEGAVLRHHTSDYILRLTKEFETEAFEEKTYTTMNKHQSRGFYYLGRLPD